MAQTIIQKAHHEIQLHSCETQHSTFPLANSYLSSIWSGRGGGRKCAHVVLCAHYCDCVRIYTKVNIKSDKNLWKKEGKLEWAEFRGGTNGGQREGLQQQHTSGKNWGDPERKRGTTILDGKLSKVIECLN